MTGATSGLGREVATRLSGRGATVYIVCRGSQDRAGKVAQEITAEAAAAATIKSPAVSAATAPGMVVPLVGDVSIAKDVRRVAQEVDAALRRSGDKAGGGLDGLVCNAGALLHERTLTSEGVETTLAAHLAHGAFLLTNELRPTLRRSSDPSELCFTCVCCLLSSGEGECRSDQQLAPTVCLFLCLGVILVSSGGMLTSKWPGMPTAASTLR